MVGGGWLQPTAPAAYFNLVGLVLLLITLRLLPFLVRPEMRPAVGMFVGLVAGYLLVDLIPSAFVLHRMCELLLAALGAAIAGWVLYRERSVVFRLIKTTAVLAWVATALDYYGALEWTTRTLKNILLLEYTLGDYSFSVSSVGIFIVVIWLSVRLAQFVRFVLDEDVLPRLDLPKGVPATISKTSTYLVVTVGSVIAVVAAGLDLSRAPLLVGALGVGIGFGLQNAVNNFVSGLILLFGRPINVGDKIQIGEISGVVRDIGIRATVVQTWQGAEVIVPNATLISDNLVNWTLSDDRRRMDISIGVAYGLSPAQVIELLTSVARAHKEVLRDPEPAAIFTGFGDSALDFELRAWTRGSHVTVASDLRLGIEKVLAKRGIEIPLPQRDLHLRTVDGNTPLVSGDSTEIPVDG